MVRLHSSKHTISEAAGQKKSKSSTNKNKGDVKRGPTHGFEPADLFRMALRFHHKLAKAEVLANLAAQV